jgi:hypothetical protein
MVPHKLVQPEAGQALMGLFFIGITSNLGPIRIADLRSHSRLYRLQSNPVGKLSELRTFFLVDYYRA